MGMKLLRATNFAATLPLNPTEVATQLADVFAPNTYLDGLKSGLGVGFGTDGYAAVVDDTDGKECIGWIVEDAKVNGQANFHCLANKQITYVTGPTEVETDALTTGLTYAAGDVLYVTTGGLFTNVAGAAGAAPNKPRAVALTGRASGSTDPIHVLLRP